MLEANPERRYTINQCLSHPWMLAGVPGVNDSTDGLVGGIAGLDVHRRGMTRERTLLSSINTVEVTKIPGGKHQDPIKIFNKNPKSQGTPAREARPADNRHPDEFAGLGGKGDVDLFGNETSHYSKNDVVAAKKGKGKK